MRKAITYSILAGIFALLLVGSVFAYQSGNRYNAGTVDKGAAEAAVESGDYIAWKELHASSNGRMASLITEENFHLLKEMHDARAAGDYARIQEIKAELGLNQGNGQGKGNGLGKGIKNHANCPNANPN